MISSRATTIVTLFLATIATSGCTAGGRDFQPATKLETGKAVIYVYRPHTIDFVANPDIPIVYLNGERVARIRINGHISMDVDAGPHTITIKDSMLGLPVWNIGEVQIEAEPSRSYYLRFTLDVGNIMVIAGSAAAAVSHEFIEIPEDIALNEIQRTKQIGSN